MFTLPSTSTNERHRLDKLGKGNDGTTYMDALCEKTDDSIDAKSLDIIMTFKNGNLVKVHNNGRPMNESDMIKYIQLDSEKDNDLEHCHVQIGKHGIGATKVRARMCGRLGKEVTTSISDVPNMSAQLEIDMGALLDPEKTPIDCWTGKSDYKPTWKPIDTCVSHDYEMGVTTEYINPCEHNFVKEVVIIDQMKKYSMYDTNIVNIFDGWTRLCWSTGERARRVER